MKFYVKTQHAFVASLIWGAFLVSSLQAMEGKAESKEETKLSIAMKSMDDLAPTPVAREIKAIRRAILWGRSPHLYDLVEGDKCEIQYGYSGKLNESSLKSFADLLYAIAGADGNLSNSEKAYVKDVIALLSSNDSKITGSMRHNTLAYTDSSADIARKGGYKSADLATLIQKHLDNGKEIGQEGEQYRALVAKSVLFTAIMAARVDGYAKEEKRAAQSAAQIFKVRDAEFALINRCCELETLLNRDAILAMSQTFAQDVKQLWEDTHKLFPGK